jgi:PAS domain S-box-containing protein
VRKDGSRFWASALLAAIRDGQGRLTGYAKVTRDLTEQRQADEALHASEERLAATLDSIGDAVLATDEQGRVTRLNPVAERLTGWSHAEALGRPLVEVFRIVNEETRRPAEDPVSKALREGLVVGLANHTALIARDGSERPIADSAAPIRGRDGAVRGCVLVFRDVSEERQANHALRRSEEGLRLLVASVEDHAIFMLDAEGRVASWNAGAERIKGYRAAEILGRHLSTFYTPEDVADGRPARLLAAATAQGHVEDEGWRVRKDGSRFWANAVITAIRADDGAGDGDGSLLGFAKVTRDFTARRKAEDDARHLQAEIAARRAAEEGERQLRLSEERYRQQSEQLGIILAGVADGVTAQDASGALLYANDAAARTCGYATAAALLAAPPGALATRFEVFDEAGQPFPWDRLPGRRALAGEDDPTAELQIRERADGRRWWTQIRARPVRDAAGVPRLAVNIWRDVTEERRRASEALFLADATALLSSGLDHRETLNRLARLAVPRLADWCAVDLLEDGELRSMAVAHVDPAKLELARELQRRTRPDPQAAHGAAWVVRTGRSELLPDIPDDVLEAGVSDREALVLVRQLGLRSAVVVPLTAGGRTFGALTLVSAESGRRFDERDLALAEDVSRRAALAVDNALLYQQARRAVRIRDEFLSIAGHELKTPLTALLLRLEGLRRLLQGEGEMDRSRWLERMMKATDHGTRLARLVDELLDVSRISLGKLMLERAPLDLGEVVAEVTDRLHEEATRAGSPIQVRLVSPVRGNWDRMRIEQALHNLLANALKYGRGRPIEVTVLARDGRTVVTVRDQGIGIDPDHHQRIFDRFERAVSDREYGGFGVGLWVAKEIVVAHGGSISVQSAPGQGATFTMELPC